MLYDCSVYADDTRIAGLHIDTDNHEFTVTRYVADERQPFQREGNVSIHYIYGFLESRIIDNGWPNMPKFLYDNSVNAYEDCRRTHGIRPDDNLRLVFPDEM